MSEGKRKSHIESWNNKTYKIQIIPHLSVWSKINTVKDFEDIFFGKSWFFVFFRPLVSLQYLFLTPECRQHRDWNGSKSYADPVIANLEFCVSFTPIQRRFKDWERSSRYRHGPTQFLPDLFSWLTTDGAESRINANRGRWKQKLNSKFQTKGCNDI